MAMLTKDRNTKRRDGKQFSDPVAANTRIFAGALVGLNAAGYAGPAGVAFPKVRGVAQEAVDNSTGAAGAVTVDLLRGCFCFANSAGADQLTRADIYEFAYIADDQTLAKTDGGVSRPMAGVLVDVDADGVWLYFF